MALSKIRTLDMSGPTSADRQGSLAVRNTKALRHRLAMSVGAEMRFLKSQCPPKPLAPVLAEELRLLELAYDTLADAGLPLPPSKQDLEFLASERRVQREIRKTLWSDLVGEQ